LRHSLKVYVEILALCSLAVRAQEKRGGLEKVRSIAVA
jgi:hypothetical protein